RGTALPFDVQDERTVFFTNDMQGTEELRPVLAAAVQGAMGADAPDNPIYRVVDTNIIKDSLGERDPNKFIVEQLAEIRAVLGNLAPDVRSLLINYVHMQWPHSYRMMVRGEDSQWEAFMSKLGQAFGAYSVQNSPPNAEGRRLITVGLKSRVEPNE